MSDMNGNGNGNQPPAPQPPPGFPSMDDQQLDVPTLVEITMMHCSFEVRTLRPPQSGVILRFKSPNGITMSVPLSEEVAKALGNHLLGNGNSGGPKLAVAKGPLPRGMR